MTTVSDIYDVINRVAPFRSQMGFDNAGLLVGNPAQAVTRVLVALDITLPVIEEAHRLDAQVIVAHHPVIFHPVKSILAGDPVGDKLMALIRYGLSAICAHTNLDVAVGGVNDALAQALGLHEIEVFLPDGVDERGREYGLGRIGVTDAPVPLSEFAAHVKRALGANGVRYVDVDRPVQKAAVGGGACGDSLRDAWARGCDVFVTADVKYDVFLDAKALGIGLIDAGHYPTEQVICPVLAQMLAQAFPSLEVRLSQVHKEPFFYV